MKTPPTKTMASDRLARARDFIDDNGIDDTATVMAHFAQAEVDAAVKAERRRVAERLHEIAGDKKLCSLPTESVLHIFADGLSASGDKEAV